MAMATDLAAANGTEDWTQGEAGANGGLDEIAAFNTSMCTPDATNNPDVAFLDTSTTPYPLFDAPVPTTCEHNVFEPIPNSVSPQSHPYVPSIEPYFPQPSSMQPFLPYKHRRSVSEPPADHHMGFDGSHGHVSPPQPHITFHRGGHYLGDAQSPCRLKSLPKHKSRAHPYGRNKSRASQPRAQPLVPHHHLHRSQTRPVPTPGPTSAPRMYDGGTVGAGNVSGSSTRVCTPEPAFDMVDPSLAMMEFGLDASGRQLPAQDRIMLEMSREELKSLVAEAVEKVIEEREAKGVVDDGGIDTRVKL